MGIERTMDLVKAKYKQAKRQKNHGYRANYGFKKETKNSRQKRDRGIEQTLDFGISKETKNSRQKIDRG